MTSPTGLPEFVLTAKLKDELSAAMKDMKKSIADVREGFANLGKVASATGTVLNVLTAPVRGAKAALDGIVKSVFNLKNVIAGAAITGAVKVFADLELALARVKVELGNSTDGFEKFRDGVKSIARETGRGFDDLGAALKEIVADEVAAGDALGVLAAAAKLATGAGLDTQTVVHTLTQLFQNFGIQASAAADVTDLLAKTMLVGRGSAESLASALGPVTIAAKDAGLGLEETLAALAAMSKGLGGFDRAGRSLSAILAALRTVNEQTRQNILTNFGFDFSKSALQTKGLATFLQELAEKIGDNEDALNALFGPARQFAGVATLVANGGRDLADAFTELRDRAGATEKSFQTVIQTLTGKFSRAKQTFLSIVEEIGGALAPVISDAIAKVKEFFDSILKRREELVVVVRGIANTVAALFKAIGTAISQGDFVQVVVNGGIAAIEGLVAIFVRSIPLVARVALDLGKAIAASLVSGFVETTKIEIGKSMTGKGFFSSIIGQSFFSKEQIDDILTVTERARVLDERIAVTTRKIRELNNFIAQATQGSNDPASQALTKDSSAEVANLTQQLQKLKEARESLNNSSKAELFSREEQDKTQAAFRTMFEGISLDAQTLFKQLSKGTSGETQKAFDQVLKVVDATRDEFKRAKESDDVLADAKEAGSSAGEGWLFGFKDKVQKGIPAAVRVPDAEKKTFADPRNNFIGNATESFNPATGEVTQKFEGFAGGLASITTQMDQLGEVGFKAGQDIATSFGNATAQLAAGTFKGREFFSSLLQGLAQVSAQAAANRLLGSLLGAVGLLGSGATATPQKGWFYHDGGLVPGVDLGYDYVPATLRGGEFVLTPEVTRAIGVDKLNGLLRGDFDPRMFEGIRGDGRPVQVRDKFATGGAVSGQGRRSNAGMATVGLLPIDDGRLDRMIAAGRGAFLRNVGKSKGALGIGNQRVT